MGKLGCRCGYRITDQADSLPYKGYVLPDKRFYQFQDHLKKVIGEFMDAIKNDTKDEWLAKYFNNPKMYKELGLTDIQMADDAGSEFLLQGHQAIFQCENCGRIAIEIGRTSHFRFFKPERDDSMGILDTMDDEP